MEGIIDRYVLAVDTVAMASGQMLLGTGGSYSNVAATLTTFPDASRRQRVTDAIDAVNAAVKALAAEDRGMHGVDIEGIQGLYLSPDPLIVGGVEIIKAQPTSPSPYHFFLPDGVHAGTVVQGLIANAFIEAMNRGYETDFTPLSDQEILANAGIPDPNPGGEPTYYDVSRFVFPETSVNTDFNHDGMVDAADVGRSSSRDRKRLERSTV